RFSSLDKSNIYSRGCAILRFGVCNYHCRILKAARSKEGRARPIRILWLRHSRATAVSQHHLQASVLLALPGVFDVPGIPWFCDACQNGALVGFSVSADVSFVTIHCP